MIEFREILIESVEDYNKLYEYVGKEAIDEQAVDTMKKFWGTKCNRIVVEYPYHDKDFLSTYYCYYSQKFREFPKKCYRLHIMGEDEKYFGYIVLRPTVKGTRLGITYLSPQPLLDEEVYLMLAKKYHNYADTTMGVIAQKIKGDMGRKTPSNGLTPVQIADLFQEYGFSPIIRGGMKEENSRFLDEMTAYIESGIPIVGFISPKQHAVSIVGHGSIDYGLLDNSDSVNKLKDEQTGIILHSKLISSLYVMEDNYFGYRKVSKELPTSTSDVDYNLYEIKFAVVPLYEKMHLVYNEVYHVTETILN